MRDLLSHYAFPRLDQVRHDFMTVAVEYWVQDYRLPGPGNDGYIRATRGFHRSLVNDAGFISDIARYQDWIIRVNDLYVFDEAIPPAAGHKIRYTENGVRHTYEVAAAGSGEDVARFTDSSELSWRVHTVEIGDNSLPDE